MTSLSKLARTSLLALLLGSIVPVMANAGDSVRLEYRFREGDRIDVEVRHRALTETTVGSTRQSTETATDSLKTWQIVAVDGDGRVTLEQSVDEVRMTSRTSDRGEITWSSSDTGSPPPGYETVRQSLGVPLTRLVIDRAGRII